MTRNYVNNDSNFDLDVTPALLSICLPYASMAQNFERNKVYIGQHEKRIKLYVSFVSYLKFKIYLALVDGYK